MGHELCIILSNEQKQRSREMIDYIPFESNEAYLIKAKNVIKRVVSKQ